MASKQVQRSRKSANSTSLSKQVLQTLIGGAQSSPATSAAIDAELSKENVTVTVRFRPLSPKEIRQGEKTAWYADGDTIVRNEHNPSIAYAYDRVFGPTTTTHHVYDVAAQHIINGAMEGVNGTIFAYGVTSSGKTHTMHGDQRSPGVIPLAVKDAFTIIQETPSREFLLRVSYIEIYNEVVNDLLNPAGQNLRIREDHQGIFVEGVKEEVVLSPAHALSLIAAGEEHRHVGYTNFNLLSSRSHAIFTLTIESSPCGVNSEGEAVNLSQLHLIDLAGSEGSKAGTAGVRQKEGAYINKSLVTLGTVISKLTEGMAVHIPYRDSKLTRFLQSSLSGHGRVSLICTVTPASSNAEETHNTLKFAHHAKHIEIQAAQNKIVDEKSLIKKYQNEIHRLKEELERLKNGIVSVPQPKGSSGEDIVLLRQKLQDGPVELQSRLEQEEEVKSALLARIQRLTKLILVSTKSSQPSKFSHRPDPLRRHSFGEEELAYLPHKRHDLMLEDGNSDLYITHDGNSEFPDGTSREEKKSRRNGLLNWLKSRKKDGSLGSGTSTGEKSSGVKSSSTPSTPQADSVNFHAESRLSLSMHTEGTTSTELSPETQREREVPEDNFSGGEAPLTAVRSIDQIDLLREQKKIVSEEVALHSSALKYLSEEAVEKPKDGKIHEEIRRLRDDISAKSEQISSLEKQIVETAVENCDKMERSEMAQTIAEFVNQLNKKTFELEVKTADNSITQEQLNQKSCECETFQAEVISLKQQLADVFEFSNVHPSLGKSSKPSRMPSTSAGVEKNEETVLLDDTSSKRLLLHAQDTEIEELKQRLTELNKSKDQLEQRNKKLAEESSYAKGLASAAAVELKALSEEVTKLMNQNERLATELASLKTPPTQRRSIGAARNGRRDSLTKRHDHLVPPPSADLKKELAVRRERELAYEAAFQGKNQREAELQRKVEESKQREAYLENELANMWVLVAKLKRSQGADSDASEVSRETPRSVNW